MEYLYYTSARPIYKFFGSLRVTQNIILFYKLIVTESYINKNLPSVT